LMRPDFPDILRVTIRTTHHFRSPILLLIKRIFSKHVQIRQVRSTSCCFPISSSINMLSHASNRLTTSFGVIRFFWWFGMQIPRIHDGIIKYYAFD
jgi:hypothetical protein